MSAFNSLVLISLASMLLGHVSSYTMEDFDKLYAEAQAPGAQIVSLVDDMLVILVALKLAYNAFIHPKRVGIHMSNRFGLKTLCIMLANKSITMGSHGAPSTRPFASRTTQLHGSMRTTQWN